jgi:hypothetical protein
MKYRERFIALRKQMIYSFKFVQKRYFEAESWWFVCWSFRTWKNAKFVKKKILLKQHEQKCQKIRRLVHDLSSSQVRETQISWIVANFFNFRKFKTRLNNEFHHWFVIFKTSKDRVRLDFNDNRLLYQIQFIHFIKKNLKCWIFNERIDRWNVYQVWKIRFHCHESRLFLHFQVLIFALLSFVNTFTIQHRLSFANERTNRKIKSNFRILLKVMSIINKMIELNDSKSLSTFTITISTACWSKFLFRWCSTQKWNLKMLFRNIFKIDVFAVRDRVVQLSKMKRVCETRWKQTLNKTKKNYNKKKAQIEFQINDKIFLNAKNITQSNRSRNWIINITIFIR